MKTEWIEDLLALARQPNFSRAAETRCITQSALSRRIQMFEVWLGTELIDRQARPLRLTPAGRQYIAEFRDILNSLNELRTRIRGESSDIVHFRLATQHSLATTRLPSLVEALAQHAERLRVDLLIRSNTRDDCIAQFVRGDADLMLCLEESDDLLTDALPQAGRLQIGTEPLILVSAAKRRGVPQHQLRRGRPLHLIASPKTSFFGHLVFDRLKPMFEYCPVDVVYESNFLAGVKEMVLAGLGVAWLPASLVMHEINVGKLAVVESRSLSLRLELELSLYHHAQVEGEALDLVWSLLVQGNKSVDCGHSRADRDAMREPHNMRKNNH